MIEFSLRARYFHESQVTLIMKQVKNIYIYIKEQIFMKFFIFKSNFKLEMSTHSAFHMKIYEK